MDRTRQSEIIYLETERSIGARLGMLVRSPIRVFDLYGLGIDQHGFLRDLGPTFDELSWDQYEARARRVAFLKSRFPSERARLDAFLAHYYAQGNAALKEIRDLMKQLTWEEKHHFQMIRPHRTRSIARFELTNAFHATWEDQWRVERVEMSGFAQDLDTEDPRSVVRVFDPTPNTVVVHQGFQRLLVGVAEMVEDAEAEFEQEPERLALTFHQMGLFGQPVEAASNAPEGTHQDGADYIVSALVVARHGVDGGVSKVKSDDRKTDLLEIELQPGQGLFQADRHSGLWHDITSIRLKDSAFGEVSGARHIFGFDINVVGRRPRRR